MKKSSKGSRDMRESQRALELRKFYAPDASENGIDNDFNESLNNDGALDAYAETIVWRLKAKHAMVSLVDQGTQYFLAGAVRAKEDDNDAGDVMTTGTWYGCSTVETPGGLCENTIAIDRENKTEYPCFIVNDLSQDSRFAGLAVVDGRLANYRFYAGAPIVTSRGVSIGSLFVFDDQARSGLTFGQRKVLHQQASNVMKHLETKREAAERRRAALMSQGIATFLETTSRDDEVDDQEPPTPGPDQEDKMFNQVLESTEFSIISGLLDTNEIPPRRSAPQVPTTLDKIRVTLDLAADILKSSLELDNLGGVLFLDASANHTELENREPSAVKPTLRPPKESKVLNEFEERRRSLTERDAPNRKASTATTRSSMDKYNPSKVLAVSRAENATWNGQNSVNAVDTETVNTLIQAYPKGNIWYIDDEGYFSSLEQVTAFEEDAGRSPWDQRSSSASSLDLSQQRSEGLMLSKVFHKARQVMFIPVWDAGNYRWYAGCFVWSKSVVPVFAMDSELSYLSAFMNSLMIEISRLDAITSNKMKSDFISSISHEFRSPLHGILASAESLRESVLDAAHVESISIIQSCGKTLLDTINHVLDYSKINSFEKVGHNQGTLSNELYQATNLALLCEDVVSGMVAANSFRGASADADAWTSSFSNPQVNQRQFTTLESRAPLKVVLDMESRDWVYNVQAGALRRIVMNIFGNAQKYTSFGSITVQLAMGDGPRDGNQTNQQQSMVLHIRDTGRGMSTEYMERKLYHPFAQEDSFAPGVGLGLSIVWGIVSQLGGKISIRSELGKGTDVEIILPVEKVNAPTISTPDVSDNTLVLAEAEQCLERLRDAASGKSVALVRTREGQSTDASWRCVEQYCTQWFGLIVGNYGDIVVTDTDDFANIRNASRVLLIEDEISNHRPASSEFLTERACHPLGPFKLARLLLSLLNQQLPEPQEDSKHNRNAYTQTPIGSPEERNVMNGIIMQDYGFPDSISTATASSVPASPDIQPVNVITGLSTMTLRQPTRKIVTSPETTTSTSATTTQTNAKPSSPPLESQRSPDPTPVPAKTGLHILAVDDNAVNLTLLQRFLSKRPHDTIALARDGSEAVSAVKTASEASQSFDIIFMDINMPIMDGFDATTAIREFEVEGEGQGVMCRSYIVALTGLASKAHREKAVDCGFDDFLTKPYTFKVIGEMMERLRAV